MDLINKNYISYTILAVGLLCYCIYMCTMQFIPATIVMSTSLLLWIAFNIYCNSLDKALLARILSLSGIILSLSVFFIFGVEEAPFPVGAIIFHAYGISIALLMFLLSLLPLLFMNNIDLSPHQETSPQSLSSQNMASEDAYNVDDHWEIATDSDLESGDFEVAA